MASAILAEPLFPSPLAHDCPQPKTGPMRAQLLQAHEQRFPKTYQQEERATGI